MAGEQRPPSQPVRSDDNEVGSRQRKMFGERRELGLVTGGVAVGIEEERAGIGIVDDAVIGVVRVCADMEANGGKLAVPRNSS